MEWISVDKIPPEDGQEVLACRYDENSHFCQMMACVHDKDAFFELESGMECEGIDYWMPLPPAPGEAAE